MLRILTISASPYLITRNGKINSDIIRALVAKGHQVSSLVWHHDEGYFLPDMQGNHFYEFDDKKIADLYPIVIQSEQASARAYEVMKKVQPQVVLTIGDYDESQFVYALKAMYPSFFKWVALLTLDSAPINENYRNKLEYVDAFITLSDWATREVQKVSPVMISRLRYGPSEAFKPLRLSNPAASKYVSEFKVVCPLRNAQTSNIPVFIKAVSEAGLNGHLHTNYYDPGECDIDLLLDRYDARNNISLTEEFTSIKDGPSDEYMNELYNTCHAVVDCSVRSSTAISMLDAMATGAIPVGPDYGTVGEVISFMPKKFQFFVPYEIYVGAREEDFVVLSKEGLKRSLLEIQCMYEKEFDGAFSQACKDASGVSRKFSKELFLNRVISVIEQVISWGETLVVASYT